MVQRNDKMGIGSSYLQLQTYGGSILGSLIILVGGIGMIIAQTFKWKVIWGGIGLFGLIFIIVNSKIRKDIENTPTSYETIGKVGLAGDLIGTVIA